MPTLAANRGGLGDAEPILDPQRSVELWRNPTPFFFQDRDRYVPTEASGGYWAANTLSGRLVGGLLGFALERAFGEAGFVPARLSVDLLRPPPRAPLRVATRLLRGGGRLKLADAEVSADGLLVARATCQFLRTSDSPVATTWQGPHWDAPPPHCLRSDPRSQAHWDVRPIPAEHRRDLPRGSESAARGPAPIEGTSSNPPVLGVLAPLEARQAWVREIRELVAGYPHTPFTRVATAADFVSPLANSSETSLDFINSDFTIYLHRPARSEWIGFDLVKHHATEGIAIGECWLYDEVGPLGTVNVAAVVQQQR